MALIKEMMFHLSAYHKVIGFEYNAITKRFRVRTMVYPSSEKAGMLCECEYEIRDKRFIDISRLEAEKKVDVVAITKQIEKKIIELAEPVSPSEKLHMINEAKEVAIADEMKVIGNKKMEEFYDNITSSKTENIIKFCYNALKILPEFDGAVNA